MLISGVLLVGSRSIAPPLFDPVGSAAVPIACAIGLLLIILALGLQTAFNKPSGARTEDTGTHASGTEVTGSEATGTEAPTISSRPATLLVVALMVLYILSMNFGLRYAFATALFVLIAIPVVGHSLKLIPLALIVAVVLGFGSEWVFTQLFFVDLPGA